jgi:hypothetical protein
VYDRAECQGGGAFDRAKRVAAGFASLLAAACASKQAHTNTHTQNTHRGA